jgi:hypothetical protein
MEALLLDRIHQAPPARAPRPLVDYLLWALGFGALFLFFCEVWVLGFGFWVLGFGFWSFGFWVVSFVFCVLCVLCFGFWVLGFGFWVLGLGFWVWGLGQDRHAPGGEGLPCRGGGWEVSWLRVEG